jgi:hypothetical protein
MDAFVRPPGHPDDGPEYAVMPLHSADAVELVFYREMRLARSLEAFSEAVAMAGDGAVRRLLVDVTRVGSADQPAEQKAFAKLVQATGLRTTDRIAGIITAGDRRHDPVQPAMTDAGYTFRMFADRDAAIGWLGSDEPA